MPIPSIIKRPLTLSLRRLTAIYSTEKAAYVERNSTVSPWVSPGLWRVNHARGHRLLSSPATAAATPPLLARPFSFYPPTTPLELNSHVVHSDAPFHSLELSHFQHSLVTLGACIAKEFSRPPAQLAGSLMRLGRAGKRLRALPTLYVLRL